jgi:hypothetical protein
MGILLGELIPVGRFFGSIGAALFWGILAFGWLGFSIAVACVLAVPLRLLRTLLRGRKV